MSDWRSGSASDAAEENPVQTAGEDRSDQDAEQLGAHHDAHLEPLPESADESTAELSPYDVLDSLVGQEPTEEEIQRRQVEGMWDALEDGTAVNEVAEGHATYDRWIGQLKAANPGIDNPEAIEEMGPILEGIAEVYGPQLAYEPVVIEQAYQAVGGAERFAPDPDEERWMKVIPKPNQRDAFSR